MSFTKKINSYYRTFTIDDADVMKEWIDRLSNYDKEDITRRFDEHLNGENALNPPMLHLLIKNLPTIEEKTKRDSNDYIIRCNLCGKEMSLSTYDKKHYPRCLTIHSLIPLIKEKILT